MHGYSLVYWYVFSDDEDGEGAADRPPGKASKTTKFKARKPQGRRVLGSSRVLGEVSNEMIASLETQLAKASDDLLKERAEKASANREVATLRERVLTYAESQKDIGTLTKSLRRAQGVLLQEHTGSDALVDAEEEIRALQSHNAKLMEALKEKDLKIKELKRKGKVECLFISIGVGMVPHATFFPSHHVFPFQPPAQDPPSLARPIAPAPSAPKKPRFMASESGEARGGTARRYVINW